ncbi:MAG: hypothetical protein KDH94_01805, partial [Coxiellaceae bacterium]|nr:hypothetical protein [Coxiellaceae bacterium]
SYFFFFNFNESEKTLTTNGFTLKFTSQKPLAPSNNTQDSEAKPVEILSIEATDYQKKAGENEPANKDDAELDAIAHAYALAFKANLKNPTDPLQIEITKFGKKWGRDKVRDAFIKAGFVRIKFEGETTYAHDKLEQVVKEQKESTERERAKVEAKRLEAGNPTPKEEVVNSNSSMLGGFFNDHALLTSAGVTTAMDTFLLSSLPPYLRYTGDAAIFLGANLLINESVRTALLQQLSRLNPFTPEAKETRELVATSAAGLSMAVGFAYLSSQLPAARNVLGDEAIWQGFSLSTLQNGAMAMPSAVFNFGFNALRMMAPKVLEQLASYGIDRFKMGSALQRHRVKQYLGYATSLAMLASGNYWGFAIGAGISSVVTAFNQEKREQFFEMFNQVDVLLHDVEVAPDNGKVLDGNKIIISEVADQENQYRISYVARNGAVTHHTLDPNSKSDLEKALIEQLKTTKFETFQSTALYDRTGVRGLAMAVVGEKNGKMGTPRFTVEDAKGFAKALPSKAKEGALTLVRPAWQASRQKVTDTWSSYTPNQQLGVSLTAAGAFLMASYFEGVLSGLAPDLTSGLTSGLVSKQWDAGSMQAFGFLALPVAAGLYTMHHDNQAQRAQEINSADGSVAQEAALIEAKKGTLAKGAAAFATTLVAENVLAYGGSFFSNPVAEQGVNLPDGEAITAFLGSMSSMMSNLSAFDSAGVLLPLLLLLVVGGSYMMMNKMFELQKSSAPAAPH